MFERIFAEVDLTVVELPIELVEERPVYSGYLKELPMITGTGHSRQELYQQLAEKYKNYRELNQLNQTEETEQTALLSPEQLLKYYDGETFDGFSLDHEEKDSEW